MLSTSLEWEFESPSLFVGRKLLKVLVVERRFNTSVIVHSSSLLTNFLSNVFTAHCSYASSLSLPHTHTYTWCSHTLTQLLWSEISICISLHFTASTMHINAAISYHSFSVKPCPCSFQSHSLQGWLKGVIMYLAFLEQKLNLKNSPLASLSSPQVDASSALIKRQKDNVSMKRKWKWNKQRKSTRPALPVRYSDEGNTKI